MSRDITCHPFNGTHIVPVYRDLDHEKKCQTNLKPVFMLPLEDEPEDRNALKPASHASRRRVKGGVPFVPEILTLYLVVFF